MCNNAISLCFVAACSLPFATSTNQTDCLENECDDLDEDFNIFGLETWSAVVSISAIVLSLVLILFTCILCCFYLCWSRRGRRKPGHELVDTALWTVPGLDSEQQDTSHFNTTGETCATADGVFGSKNSLALDPRYQNPKIAIQEPQQEEEEGEEVEEIYDDGATVQPSPRPVSHVYAETYTLHTPRGLNPPTSTSSEPIYNNISNNNNSSAGDNTSQNSVYMQLLTQVPDNETYTVPSIHTPVPTPRRPKDNTEDWNPPNVCQL